MKPSLRNSTWYAKLLVEAIPRGSVGRLSGIPDQKVTEWHLSLSCVFDFVHFPVEISEIERVRGAAGPPGEPLCLSLVAAAQRTAPCHTTSPGLTVPFSS